MHIEGVDERDSSWEAHQTPFRVYLFYVLGVGLSAGEAGLVVHGVAPRLLPSIDDQWRYDVWNPFEEGDLPAFVVDDPVVAVAEQDEVV